MEQIYNLRDFSQIIICVHLCYSWERDIPSDITDKHRCGNKKKVGSTNIDDV